MRRALTLAAVALLVLAGCSGAPSDGDVSPTAATDAAPGESTASGGPPTATPVTTTSVEPVETPTTDYRDLDNVDIRIENGAVPYDPNRTWVRVLRLLEVNAAPPTEVQYVPGRQGVAGSATGVGSVYLDSEDEAVLAHEFAHVALLGLSPEHPTSSADERFAHDAVVEGAAEYVQREYAARYLDRRNAREVGRLPSGPARGYVWAPYVYGYRYVRENVDDAGELLALHRYPPDTSEAVLHGDAPASEPPAPLRVTVADDHLASDAEWQYAGTRRLGELTLRLALRTRLDETVAAEGAAGWGNDRVLTMHRGDRRAFVWVLRWDDRANASEFETVGGEYVDANQPPAPPGDGGNLGNVPYPEFVRHVWGPTEKSIAVQRVGPRTTALVVGPDSFVADVTYERDGRRVVVSVADG